MTDKERLDALSALILLQLSAEPPRPKLRLITAADFDRSTQAPGLDSPTRSWITSRIHDLRRMYGLDWLVRQETRATQGSITALEDDQLRNLLADVERAAQCLRENVPLEDAGLIRTHST